MNRIIIVIVLMFCILLNADELSDKQAELDKLNQELQEMENILKRAKTQKVEKQSEIVRMQDKKAELEKTICDLEVNQCKAQAEWEKTRQHLEQTAQNLDNKKQSAQELYNSAHELGVALITSHYSRRVYNSADTWILATSLEAAGEELKALNADINSLESRRQVLAKKEKKDEKYFKDVQWTKIVSKKKKNRYQDELVILDKEISSLDEEYENALSRKRELEEARTAMNDLIASLQGRLILKPDYSYKFTYKKLIWPLEGKLIRSFGDYQGDNKRVTLHNDGIDIAAAMGTEVMCVDKGVVVYCNRQGGSGRVVIIDHQNGFYTVYSHNDELLVSLGDTVEKGTILAKSGQSGLVDEPCLHFEIRRDGKAVDPLEYLKY